MKLALFGGTPIRNPKNSFPRHNFIGKEEKEAVNRVIDSGVLSGYQGSWGPDFMGGPEVKALEMEWAEHFKVKHAIAVNTATSGLYAAVGAAGIGPGDEVIVPSYSMSASATGPLIYGGIPVFADIEKDFYCPSFESIEKAITPHTKAIYVVNLFGQPFDADKIMDLARAKNLLVIEDAAQSPGALYKGRFAGTLADVGVFSLNRHKHIHCGEGGMVVTNHDHIADRIRLIRNHGESVIRGMGHTDFTNIVGFNYRMTELEASVARCQLKKLDTLLAQRQKNAAYLSAELSQLQFITTPKVRPDCTHSYYIHTLLYDESQTNISIDKFVRAVAAEVAFNDLDTTDEPGNIAVGYTDPLYMRDVFQRKIAIGKDGFPWSGFTHGKSRSYTKGLCPIVENIEPKVITHENMRPPMTKEDMDDFIQAFHKVWECSGEFN